jgi:hypothetical protein
MRKRRDEEGPPVVVGETEDQTYDIVSQSPRLKILNQGSINVLLIEVNVKVTSRK